MGRVKELYKYFSDKRFSTIAGTLAYFLLMSVAPFLFWIALIIGKIDLPIGDVKIFSAIAPLISQLSASAESAAGGAGIVLILTSLYSSTNFFYHLRRSGEIIYETKRNRSGIKLRLASVLVIIFTLLCFSAVGAISLFGAEFLYKYMPMLVAEAISYAFMAIFALLAAYFLNVFACPYKLKFGQAISGSLLTVILWIIFACGFTVYLNFANPQRLYGTIAAVIVFLLWSYIMINCLVIGIIYNGMFLTEKKRKFSVFGK